MVKALVLGLGFAVLPLTTALAAQATAEEASRLTTLFERYVGTPAAGQPSAVTVAPDGDSYRVTLDLKQTFKGFGSLGMTVDPAMSTTRLTPLADGTWKVATTDFPPLVIHMRDQSIAVKVASFESNGVYDPRMFAFKSIDTQISGYDSSATSPNSAQTLHVDKRSVTLSGMPAEDGTVTGAVHDVAVGARGDGVVKPPSAVPPSATGETGEKAPPAPPTAFAYAAPSGTIDLAFEKLHSKNLLDLWAFLVAHPGRDNLAATQDELRGILRATLPIVSALRESGTADTLSVTTPIGLFAAKTASTGIDLADLDGVAKATTRFVFGGLTVPTGQLPPWSQGLVPTDLSLAVGVEGLHAAEAAAEAVNDFDLKSDRPFTPDQTARISHLAMPGLATVTLLPSRLTSSLLDIRLDGGATLGGAPDGHLSIKANGLDKAIASLQAASAKDPSAGQALGPLVLAKNLAKPEADGSLSWLVAVKDGGPVTVNGTPLQ